MEISINIKDNKKSFTINSDRKETIVFREAFNNITISKEEKGISVLNSKKKNIQLSLFRDGLNAYQLALRNGTFQGTEQEFSESQIHPLVDFTAYYILSKS